MSNPWAAIVCDVEFSERLSELRRERGLTQDALAERAEIHISQLRRYEAGTNEPTLGVIARLAVALATTADVLVFGDDSRLSDDERVRLAYESTVLLDPDEREAVICVLEGFLARHDALRGGEGPRAPKSKRS